MKFVDWVAAIEACDLDVTAGIKIAKLCGDAKFSTFLTHIAPGKHVNAHYHKHGVEHYHVIEGTGEIELTHLTSRKSITRKVEKYCSFVVEENTIHTLSNIGNGPLILMFSCPESHLNDDRFLA